MLLFHLCNSTRGDLALGLERDLGIRLAGSTRGVFL